MFFKRVDLRQLLGKRFVRIGLIAIGVFVLLNAGVWLLYRTRTYPNTTIAGKAVGSVSLGQLHERLQLPSSVELVYKDNATTLSVSELGVSVNAQSTKQQAKTKRAWLPLLNFVTSHHLPLATNLDADLFADRMKTLAQEQQQTATDAQIVQTEGVFELKPEVAGHTPDTQAAAIALREALAAGGSRVEVPAKTLTATIVEADLVSAIEKLRTQQKTSVTLRYGSSAKQFSESEIGNWFIAEGQTYQLSESRIQAAVISVGSSFGIGVQNLSQLVDAIHDSVQQHTAVDLTLIAAPKLAKTYSYCVQAKNIDDSHFAAFEAKLASAYADTRGWNLGGLVTFVNGEGCNFTVWLAAADTMSSFGAICDSNWSCRVGSNVVINFDRWTNASAAWNAAGGSLDDYRSMVINHETGHWLGFGHSSCPGAGQLAPVMQQQSIDLEGCKFNPWPTASELTRLKSKLGL